MSPTIYNESTTSERLLEALHPSFAWLSEHFPKAFGPPASPPPHPSAMLLDHNWLWRLIFPRFFARIRIERSAIDELREASRRSTLVYVAKGIGQLEYHYFNHLFLNEGLPLAQYCNTLTMRRWMHWKAYWASILAQESEIAARGHPFDPLQDGALPGLIAEGKSILLALPSSGLSDEGLFFTGPVHALAALIEAQRRSAKSLSIVPLEFLWSRRPESAQRSVLDILFGEKESPGLIRKVVLFWRNYKTHAQAAIGHPIDLQTFINWEGGDDRRLTSRLRETLVEALKAKRRVITGPPLRPRHWFIQAVTSDEELDDDICRIAAERGKPADDVRDLATRYAHEIAADLDYTTIELLDKILSPAFRRIFDAFVVDEQGLSRIKELYAEGPVVFVPNHKSHADYLLLSLILYHHGMTVPHIAAGINLEFWPLGPIFRRGGAYFIRRAFSDNPLYRSVLETYLKVLLREGYSQEFFIEGSRSRTGKLLKPRKGMLTMLHRAAARARVARWHFIPVSITYDRVIEQKSYERELEGGQKVEERTSHLFGLTKFLRRPRHRYGSLYVRFGEPLPALADGSDPAAIGALSERICQEINRRIVVTPAAVAAAALLADARRGVTRRDLERHWTLLVTYLRSKGVELSALFTESPQTALDEAVARLAQTKLVTPRCSAIDPFYAIDERKRVALSFFKNSIVHFLASASVISALLLKSAEMGQTLSFAALADDVEDMRTFLAHEFRFASSRATGEHVAAVTDFLVSQGAIEHAGDGTLSLRRQGAWICTLLASQIRPFLETFFVTICHITSQMKDSCEGRTLVEEMMQTGQDLFLLESVNYQEGITKAGFENVLRALVSTGILSKERISSGSRRKDMYHPPQDEHQLLILKAKLQKVL